LFHEPEEGILMAKRQFHIFLISVLSVGLVVWQAPTGTAQQPPAPGAVSTQEQYPEGSRWPQAEYERTNRVPRLQASQLTSGATVSSAAAPLIQPELPAGITLQAGTATRISIQASAARLSAPRPGAVDPMATPGVEPVAPQQQTIEKWFVSYPVEFRGVRLAKFSDVLAIVSGDGQTLYTRKRNLPREVDGTEPTVDRQAAVNLAQGQARQVWGESDLQASEPRLEVWVDPDLRGRLAWTFVVASPSLTSPRAQQYWVAARGEARVLNAESTIFHDHKGAVTGTLWPTTPLKPTENRSLPDLDLTRLPNGDHQLTAENGRYSFPGTGNVTIKAAPGGAFSVVQNQGGGLLTWQKAGGESNAIDLDSNASAEFDLAQISAFHWTNVTFRFAKDILEPLATQPWAQLPTRVNINSSCNAFWDGSSINFFKAGGACPNTAYSDVVHHEYGHGIDHWRGGIVDGGYSEGFGDAVAILITRQSCLGRDFSGAGTCLRPATDVNLWPPAPGEGVHSIGKRYAQFTWQLLQELKKTASEEEAFRIASRLVLAAAAGNPADIPDAVKLSFLADDDDGDLNNGTPHCLELGAAADSRNIPRPACPSGGRGFVWANNPTAANYTPTATYAYNSAGGPITITRASPGVYAVSFANLGGQGKAGGHVQVTAYGTGSETCKVASWASAAADFVANVRCFSAAGAAADSRYTALVIWP